MTVALYIKTPKYQNANTYTSTNFIRRVKADGGTFESGSCLTGILESLGNSFETLETYRRIELFDDEKISVTSSIQNVNDISKIFTDYSQSFTIPASANNNEIFKHWYENSLDNGFDQRIRYSGYIEIDTQTFRSGKWQLESASVKNNRVEDYKITFYGELKSLSDKFGDEKLQDVKELNDYTLSYSGDLVGELVTTPLDASQTGVMFPLISSKRTWAAGADSPTSSSTPIVYNELFPAIKLPLIFNAFETRYGVNFNGVFLDDERFTKAYLWLKNNEAETYTMTSAERRIEIQATENDGNFYADATNNTVTAVGFENNGTFTINVTSATNYDMTLTVYKDGAFFGSIQGVTNSISYTLGTQTGTGVFHFTIKKAFTAATPTFNYTYNANQFIVSNPRQPTDGLQTTFSDSGSIVMGNLIDLAVIAPDMKVSDFFAGVLKMFNLTCFSEDGVNYNVEQLENWYFLGGIKDFSGYTTTDFEYTRIKPYKKIDFKYQKNESVLNRTFYDRNAREYGDLNYAFLNDGSDYTIQLPFENLLFNSWNNTSTSMASLPQVGYAFKPDLKPFKPKGVILYYTGGQPFAVDWHFSDGANPAFSFDYANVFGADVNVNRNETNTLNWGVEVSTVYFENIYRTLFANYYLDYLNNLYSLKSRLVKVKMRLPYLELLNLKLNDRIVIRDKRYIINQFTTDLTTFESEFELIQDFRSINYDNSSLRTTDNTVKTLRFNTTSIEPLTWTIETDEDDMLTGILNADTYVDVQVKANVTGLPKIATITSNLNDQIIIEQDA